MRFSRLAFSVWASCCVASAGRGATDGVANSSQLVADAIPVTIYESIPDQPTWEFKLPKVTESYREPAFAWPLVPRKYSEKGIVVDRALPLMLRGEAEFELPQGEYRFLLRAMGAARFYVDGKLTLETKFRQPSANGNEAVPKLAGGKEPDLRLLPVGHMGVLTTLALDGRAHKFRLEAIYGDQKLRPELGELSVSVSPRGKPFYLLAPELSIRLTNEGWQEYIARARVRQAERAAAARTAAAGEAQYWDQRHEIARQEWRTRHATENDSRPTASDGSGELDRLIGERLARFQLQPAKIVDDPAFLRRLTLDLTGLIPSAVEMADFQHDAPAKRRSRAIDRLLTDTRWADAWVGYWQDVLAENPGILKPELNNSGPFRFWIHESLQDNKPLDRFATELVMMEGSVLEGGPAGFAVATQNDAPFAEKAHILAKAFLAVDLKCARCHDAPYQPYKQSDTFQLAAMLGRGQQTLSMTSSVPMQPGGRKPHVTLSLMPGDKIEPAWPFGDLAPQSSLRGGPQSSLRGGPQSSLRGGPQSSLRGGPQSSLRGGPQSALRGGPRELPAGLLDKQDTRGQLAAYLTSNERFARVLANRVWKRLIGWGLVEPVDDWNEATPAQPELLEYLAGELVTHGYDLKHLTRVIVTSQFYQRAAQPPVAMESASQERVWVSPARRRMSAEQVVDSLYAAVGKSFRCEELTFDPEARQKATTMSNLGVPRRAWEFVGLSNERDRPALSLPIAQSIIDLLITFGWRESRQNPASEREEAANVLQPLVLANGVAGHRVVILSDDSAITKLCLEEWPLDDLIKAVVGRVLSRPPSETETARLRAVLADGYETRRGQAPESKAAAVAPRTSVSWSNHLSPEATQMKRDLEKAARAGDPPTQRLQADWRERMEDVLWALVNSPEFVFVP